MIKYSDTFINPQFENISNFSVLKEFNYLKLKVMEHHIEFHEFPEFIDKNLRAWNSDHKFLKLYVNYEEVTLWYEIITKT